MAVICIMLALLSINCSYDGDSKVSSEYLKDLVAHGDLLVREGKYQIAMDYYTKIDSLIDKFDGVNQDSLKWIVKNYHVNLSFIMNSIPIPGRVFHITQDSLSSFMEKELQDLPYSEEYNQHIERYIKYYQRSRQTLSVTFRNALFYLDDVKRVFKMQQLPEELAYLPLIESGYNPMAYSYAGASGIWQFIESTGKLYGLSKNWWIDERKDIVKSTIAASRMLRSLYDRFGDWKLVLAAYNCGHGRVRKAILEHGTSNFWKLKSLPRQTREYVPKFYALTSVLSRITPNEIQACKMYLDTIHVVGGTTLKSVADAIGIEYEQLKLLNPEIRQWCVPPMDKRYALIIPADKRVFFYKNYCNIADSVKLGWENIIIKKRTKYSQLANARLAKIEGLLTLNNEKCDRSIAIGDTVRVPRTPIKKKWFNDFNKIYLTSYENEKYFYLSRKNIKYIVRKGDTLWDISRKFDLPISRIKGWNKLADNRILPGKMLNLYF